MTQKIVIFGNNKKYIIQEKQQKQIIFNSQIQEQVQEKDQIQQKQLLIKQQPKHKRNKVI